MLDAIDVKVSIVVGFGVERSTVPKISTSLPLTDNLKFIRNGTLQKYSDSKNSFEECQLKLHHDYLTFYKLKEKCTCVGESRKESDFHAVVELDGGDGER